MTTLESAPSSMLAASIVVGSDGATLPAALPVPPVLVAMGERRQVHLVRRTLAAGGLTNPVLTSLTIDGACAYLRAEGPYQDRQRHPPPAVVVTDLRFADGSGLDVLHAARAESTLRRLPVVVVGDAASDAEVDAVHRLGAAAYLARPVLRQALLGVIRELGMPWALTAPPSRPA